MLKKIQIYFFPVLFTCLGIIIQVLSETKVLDALVRQFFIEEKAALMKTVISVLSYIVFVVPLGWQAAVRGKRSKLYDSTVTRYVNEQRQLIASILEKNKFVNGTTEDINIRIFRRRFGRLVLENEDRFYSRGIEGRLSFDIKKKEGLCAQALVEGRSMLEIEDASKPEYNLTERQKALAGNLKFIVAVPIQPDNGRKPKHVICFDSFQKIAKAGCEQGILKQCESVAYTIGSMMD